MLQINSYLKNFTLICIQRNNSYNVAYLPSRIFTHCTYRSTLYFKKIRYSHQFLLFINNSYIFKRIIDA